MSQHIDLFIPCPPIWGGVQISIPHGVQSLPRWGSDIYYLGLIRDSHPVGSRHNIPKPQYHLEANTSYDQGVRQYRPDSKLPDVSAVTKYLHIRRSWWSLLVSAKPTEKEFPALDLENSPEVPHNPCHIPTICIVGPLLPVQRTRFCLQPFDRTVTCNY